MKPLLPPRAEPAFSTELTQQAATSRRRWLAYAAAGLLPALAGPHAAAVAAAAVAPAAAAAQPPLRVVASFSLLADMAREAGGPHVQVQALVGPDADAHVFSPTPAHVQRLAQAELVIVNGLGFEGWLDRLVHAAGYRGPLVVATAGIQPRPGGRHADPHAWQSLVHAQRYVENIRAGLVLARPQAAADINARAADYTRRIAALDASIRQAMEQIPAADRVVLTSHNAFAYFGEAYGVEFRAAQGWNTGSEASAAQVARLIEQLRRQRVRALFVENISDPRLLERIAAEGNARLGGRLYSDALSGPGTPGESYLGMMRHNAEALLAALRQAS